MRKCRWGTGPNACIQHTQLASDAWVMTCCAPQPTWEPPAFKQVLLHDNNQCAGAATLFEGHGIAFEPCHLCGRLWNLGVTDLEAAAAQWRGPEDVWLPPGGASICTAAVAPGAVLLSSGSVLNTSPGTLIALCMAAIGDDERPGGGGACSGDEVDGDSGGGRSGSANHSPHVGAQGFAWDLPTIVSLLTPSPAGLARVLVVLSLIHLLKWFFILFLSVESSDQLQKGRHGGKPRRRWAAQAAAARLATGACGVARNECRAVVPGGCACAAWCGERHAVPGVVLRTC